MRATVKFLALSAAMIGWLSVASHRAEAVVTITLGSTSGMTGDTVPVDATLSTGTDMVAGTQNDITLPTGLSIGQDQDGNPNCVVNSAIHKTATSFAYLPAGCTVGTDCTGVRAIVLSLTNVTPIPDGSKLYTCQVTIASDAPSGDLVLDNTNANSSDPSGTMLATNGVAGTVTVEGTVTHPVIIHVGTATGAQGTTASFDVTLESTVDVAGSQNDIGFDPKAQIPMNQDGNPDCTVNPAIKKSATSFAYLPAGCTVGTDCTGVRAIVLSLTNVTVIPTGSRLYTCNVAIASDATGTKPLPCSNANSSDPSGAMLDTGCTDGSVVVSTGNPTLASAIDATQTTIPLSDASAFPSSGTIKIDDEQITYTGKDGNTLTGATRGANGTTASAHAQGASVSQVSSVTPTSTATGQASPTATATTQVVGTSTATRTLSSTFTPTVVPQGTNTATRTVGGATATATRTTGGGVFTPTTKPTAKVLEDDGCAVVGSGDASAGWILLLPAAMLLWVRRRTR